MDHLIFPEDQTLCSFKKNAYLIMEFSVPLNSEKK